MIEAILIERAAKGDMDAFSEIYTQIYDRCVKYIRSQSHDEAIAQQVVQDTVLHFMEDDFRVLKNLKNYSAFEGYFFKAARNHFFNLKNKGRTVDGDVKEVLVDEIYDVAEDGELNRFLGTNECATPEQLVEQKEIKEILMSLINELPETQKEAFTLSYLDEMKQTEIAEILNVPLNTVKSYLLYAKKKLRRKIEEYEKKTGTKLHSVVPILPLLRLAYNNEEIMRPDLSALLTAAGTTSASTVGASTATAATVGASTGSVVSAGTATGATAAAGVATKIGGATVTKVIAGVLAAAVVGTGAVVVPKLADNTPVDEPIINDTVIIHPEEHIGEIDLSWLDEDLRPAVTGMEVDPALGVEMVQFIKERYAEMQTLLQKDYTFMQDDGYTTWYESADGYQKGISGDPDGDYGSISIYREELEYYTETEGNLIMRFYTDTYVSGELERFMYESHGQGIHSDVEEYYGDRKIDATNVMYTYIPMYNGYAYEVAEYPEYQEGVSVSCDLRKEYSFSEDGTVLGIFVSYDNSPSGTDVSYSYTPTVYGGAECVLSQILVMEGNRVTSYAVDGTVMETYDVPEFVM